VVYHNKYADTRGWVKTSAAFMDKSSGKLVQRTLADGLNLPGRASDFVIFRDYVTHLEYIRSCRELVEKGLFVLLGAYQCQVFLDWRFVNGAQWKSVFEGLNGSGVESIQAKFDELFAVKEVMAEEKPRAKKKPAARKRPANKPSVKGTAKQPAKSKKKKPVARKKTA
jgi:hypothetical protein